MSDTRFDGRQIYRFMSARRPVYDIRGRYIYKANSENAAAEYEIRGDYIHEASSKSRQLFHIHGDKIRKMHRISEAVFEIR